MTVWGTMVTGTVLAATDICGFLCARYDVTPPPNLQNKYDGFSWYFSVSHVLSCSCGGLVVTCHNEVYDDLLCLS